MPTALLVSKSICCSECESSTDFDENDSDINGELESDELAEQGNITISLHYASMNAFGTKNITIICNLDKLLALASAKCREPDCAQTCHVTHYKMYGCCIVIQYQCSRGHKFVWASSEMSMNKSNNKLFKNNLVFSSAVVLSGLSYYKVSDFAKIIGLSISSSTSFHSYQRHYICPGIQVYFDKEQVLYLFELLQSHTKYYKVIVYFLNGFATKQM